MNNERLRRYVELRRQQKDAESEAEDYKVAADEIEKDLLSTFADEGVQRIAIDVDGSPMTVYLYSQTWASAKEKTDGGRAALADALRSIGQGHMVQSTVNSQTLSGYVRDLDKVGEPIPDELAEVISIAHTHALRVRRG